MKLYALILLVCSPFLVAGEQRVMTPEDVTRLKSVRTVKMSPDGQYVAYTLSVPRKLFKDKNGRAFSHLYVWDAENGSRPFITSNTSVSNIRWTADSKYISFLSKRDKDKKRSLYMIPVTGGEARRVLTHKTDISSFEWKSSSEVLFRAKDKADKEEKKLKEEGFNQEIYEEGLLYTRLYHADLVPEKPTIKQIKIDGNINGLSVSPDGLHMAVSVAPTPLVDDSYVKTRIRMMKTDGSLVRKIDNPGKLGQITWSPDGKTLAFRSAADKHDPSAGRLWTADLKDGLNKYFMDAKGDVGSFEWRDNNTINVMWYEGVDAYIKTLDLGTGKTSKPDAKGPIFPAISMGSKRMALAGDTPEHPRELFIWEEGKSSATRITNSNPWLDDIKMGKQEAVTYTARDGLKIQGVLIRPVDEVKGKRYPLIMIVHGGPEAHEKNGWLTNYSKLGQVAAGQGFAVFYPNYRASTGRGVAFSKLDHGRPAMEEFDDLVDAITHLSDNMGLVDKKRVGVTGGSYGGYATAWCSTALTEHFAAGVMFVGISNKISKMGTSDIPDEVYLVHDRHRLWEDWDLFLKQSPIYHVEKARTPLLIMHGKEDPRVPPGQSMELYRSLKILGNVPVRLVYYPGEGHGNRKAAAQYDYNLRALRWFKHYLQGEGGEKPPYQVDYSAIKEDQEDGASED